MRPIKSISSQEPLEDCASMILSIRLGEEKTLLKKPPDFYFYYFFLAGADDFMAGPELPPMQPDFFW